MARASHLLQRALVLLLMAGALWHAALRFQLIADPRHDLGGGEMNVVYGTQKILLGEPLYTNPEEPLFEVVQYTPLFHLLCAAVARMAGIDALDTPELFAVGRALNLALSLLIAVLAYAIARRLRLDAWWCAATGALALAFIANQYYGRPDALATALLLGMLVLLLRRDDAPLSHVRLVWAAACAVGAALTKQNAAVGALITVAHLALSDDRDALRRFLTFLLPLGAIGLMSLLLLGAPHALYQNLVLSLRNGMGFTLYRALADQGVYKYYAGWHVLSALGIAALLRRGSSNERLIALAAAVAYAAGLAGGLKHGSGLNYLVDAHVLGAMAGFAWLRRWAATPRAIAGAALLLYGALFMHHRLGLLRHLAANDAFRAANARALAADQAVLAWLRQQDALDAERPAFLVYRGHLELLLNGYAALPQKDILEWSLTPPFDLRHLGELFRDGRISVVIGDAPMDHLSFIGWRMELAPVAEVQGRWLYRPLPAQSVVGH